MPLPLLDDRYRNRKPTRSPEDKQARLTADEQRFILWALRERWSAARIGRTLEVSATTVRRFRQRFWQEPLVLLELGLYEMVGSSVKKEYRCLVCGDRLKGHRKVERHVLNHFLEEGYVQTAMSIPRKAI